MPDLKQRRSFLSERLGRSAGTLFLGAGPVGDRRIRRAVELLHENHSITISEIATKLNLSTSRFRHLFKSELNISPTLYIKRARLEQARHLIESSFLRVKEIAAVVGANDVSHFVRDYKAFYGQTPSKARQIPRQDLR